MPRIVSTFLASLLAATSLVAQAPDTIATLPLERDIVFNPGDKEPLKLDICKPPKGTKPYPVVVCVHGGAWQQGGRAQFHQWISNLAENGYFAASIDYRLAPKHPFPAALEDVKCAIRFLRSKAKAWDLDADRFAVMGRSAGGQLVLMAGLADGFEGKGGHAEFSSKVRCIVNYMGPTDFAVYKPLPAGDAVLKHDLGRDGDGILADYLGTADRSAAIMKTASPISYVSKTSPPVLTFHGTDDTLVPVSQARLLHAALDKASVANRLELIEKEGHGWPIPVQERTEKIRLEFLEKHLKK
jgi:acetyl esterase/lipase